MTKTQKQNNYLNWQSKLAEDNLNKALQKQREDEFKGFIDIKEDIESILESLFQHQTLKVEHKINDLKYKVDNRIKELEKEE